MPERQSGFERRRQGDPLQSENLLRRQTEWFRFIAPLLGLDRHKLIVGTVLRSIIGDDLNIYFPIHDFVKDASTISIHKARAEARLSWEWGTPELPDDIKGKLLQAKTVISETDWQDPLSFNQVRRAQQKLSTDVEALIEENPDLKDSVSYARDLKIQERWRPYWQQFYREELK